MARILASDCTADVPPDSRPAPAQAVQLQDTELKGN